MDTWFVIALGLAVILAWVTGLAWRRGRTIGRIQAALTDRDEPPGLGPAAAVVHLRSEREGLATSLADERSDDSALLDALACGVVRVDGRLHVTGSNALADRLLGRPSGSLVGMTLMQAFLEPDAESIARSAIESDSAGGELRIAGPDGPALIIRARRTTDGGAWLVLDDVSELRRLQRIRAEFIDNLSHELRTPLTTVSLLAETLSRDIDSTGDGVPQRIRDRVLKIEIETGHLVQMVNELLDLARIEGGGALQIRDDIDLGSLAAESAERLRLFADRQGVGLTTDPGAGLPPVRGDAARLGQVVVNLVHNAVKFSPDGGDVNVVTRTGPGEIVVSVQDHGMGIPVAAQDRVFERFYKVDRARLRAEAGGATGLGLAIARHVVEQHGGRIWLESREGEGSTFSFAVPVGPTQATQAPSPVIGA